MNESELVHLAVGLVIGTSCGFLLAAMLAVGAQSELPGWESDLARAYRENEQAIEDEQTYHYGRRHEA